MQRFVDRFGKPDYCLPLSSAVGFLLSGQIRWDAITAYELGFPSIEALADWCDRGSTGLALPSRFTPRVEVVATATDSAASLLGAGAASRGDGMTYYGSYFGAAEVGGDLRRDMCDTQLDHFPYHWRVSLPCFGIYLEQVLAEVTSKSRDEAFDRFEQELVARPAGPIETSMTVSFNRYEYDDGSGEFVGAIGGLDDCHSFGEMAVGLASQFGLALRRAAQDGTLSNVRTWAAAGGGSRNLALVEITSQISGLVQTARSGSWTCKGTAMLAQSLS